MTERSARSGPQAIAARLHGTDHPAVPENAGKRAHRSLQERLDQAALPGQLRKRRVQLLNRLDISRTDVADNAVHAAVLRPMGLHDDRIRERQPFRDRGQGHVRRGRYTETGPSGEAGEPALVGRVAIADSGPVPSTTPAGRSPARCASVDIANSVPGRITAA